MVLKARNFWGSLFRTKRGVAQGNLVFPMIFNIVVYAVVWEVLPEIFGPQEAHQSFGWLERKHNICFYDDEGEIVGQNPIWV